jgi:hypothetical protein
MKMNKITTLVDQQAEAIRNWMGSHRMLEYVDDSVDGHTHSRGVCGRPRWLEPEVSKIRA